MLVFISFVSLIVGDIFDMIGSILLTYTGFYLIFDYAFSKNGEFLDYSKFVYIFYNSFYIFYFLGCKLEISFYELVFRPIFIKILTNYYFS